jgi:hypothetical protein
MWVSLKTEKRRSHCPVFSFRPRVRRAEGHPGMTTEDLHGYQRRSAPPALLPLICIVIPDHSSFSVLRETPMTFACGHFKKLKYYNNSNKFVRICKPTRLLCSLGHVDSACCGTGTSLCGFWVHLLGEKTRELTIAFLFQVILWDKPQGC